MSSCTLTCIRYFSVLNARRLAITRQQPSSSWNDLANVSYGQKTMDHREKQRKAFIDLRRQLEKHDDATLMEIGSYAVGASTPSSDLDVVLIPYSNDPSEERINEFNKRMKNAEFRKRRLNTLATQLSKAGIIRGKLDVFYSARVPIIKGITRSGVSFDVQFGTTETIYSTNFVRVAFQLDPRLILVYHWLRQQTENYCLFGGRENLFTAFHLYMLIIHFAQATGILPHLMDEYPIHLSRACHWRALTEEFRQGENTLPPLYTIEGIDTWAPVLTNQLVEYYGKIDFTTTEINVGKGTLRERRTNNLLLIEPFHDQNLGVCRVDNGAVLMKMRMSGILKRIRDLTFLNARRFESKNVHPDVNKPRRLRKQPLSQWKGLAKLSYGEQTMRHRLRLEKRFVDLQGILEKSNDDMKLIPIGSYAVGSSTPSSDIDVLLIPFASDQSNERIVEFNENMKDKEFKKHTFFQLRRQLRSAKGLIRGNMDIALRAKVPIIRGIANEGVSFDLQIGSIESIYSTNFVRLAFHLNPRLILAYHWLRKQTKKFNMYGGEHRKFTAFHLYMLVIHFAQATRIMPNMMDEYATHLSRDCHWRDITKEFRKDKQTIPPLHTIENVDAWAPVLINQLVEYYANIKFTTTEIDVGKGIVRERCSSNRLHLIDPFHDQTIGVCRVDNGAVLMNTLFAKLKKNRHG